MLRPASRGRVQGRDQSGFYSRGSYEQGATMQGNASECSFSYFVGFRGTFGFKNCILFFSFLLLFLNMSKIISVVGDGTIRNLVSTWQENVAKNVIRVFFNNLSLKFEPELKLSIVKKTRGCYVYDKYDELKRDSRTVTVWRVCGPNIMVKGQGAYYLHCSAWKRVDIKMCICEYRAQASSAMPWLQLVAVVNKMHPSQSQYGVWIAPVS